MRNTVREADAAAVIAQVGRTITYQSDGTLEGSVVWKGYSGLSADGTIIPPTGIPVVAEGGQAGTNHPDDARMECYNRTLVYGANGIVTCTAAYFGIENTTGKSDLTFSFSGGVTNEPIETHPDFTTKIAGTVGAPLNGAKFVTNPEADDYGSFIEFPEFTTPGAIDNNNFMGVESYLTPATNIVVSWWQDTQPKPSKTATWDTNINGVSADDFRKPQGVKNFLLMDESYSQVGNFYQVTQSYLGSGVRGWDKDIYDKYSPSI